VQGGVSLQMQAPTTSTLRHAEEAGCREGWLLSGWRTGLLAASPADELFSFAKLKNAKKKRWEIF
jgi:hypothetical protein